MSLELVVFENEVVGKKDPAEAAVDPAFGLNFLPVEGVGVSIELRVVAERLVAEAASPAAFPSEAVALPVSSLLVQLDHIRRRQQFVAL